MFQTAADRAVDKREDQIFGQGMREARRQDAGIRIELEARIAELEAQLHQATHCAVCDKPVQHPDGALHCKECVS